MPAEQTPRALRHVITIVGCRNAGKSSLINALTGQDVAIVSAVPGTTTDAVAKSYELLPLGSVTFYDTAGLDDDSSLGKQRIKASKSALYKADIALLVVGENGLNDFDKNLANELKKRQIPFIVVFNKCDIKKTDKLDLDFCNRIGASVVSVSAAKKRNINKLKELIIANIPEENKKQTSLLDGLVEEKDCVVLVTPIDASAPKGRLILPQVQVLREILDLNAFAVVAQTDELKNCLDGLRCKPKIVITDSQAILKVDKIIPQDIALTTFSVLFARIKGDLKILVDGAKVIDKLENGANILIAEACSHHIQEDDIAQVKIPNWLKKYTGKTFNFSFCVGNDFPENIEDFDLVIHCGACMLNKAEMTRRLRECVRRQVPITNYGITISKTQGILERVIKPFKIERRDAS